MPAQAAGGWSSSIPAVGRDAIAFMMGRIEPICRDAAGCLYVYRHTLKKWGWIGRPKWHHTQQGHGVRTRIALWVDALSCCGGHRPRQFGRNPGGFLSARLFPGSAQKSQGVHEGMAQTARHNPHTRPPHMRLQDHLRIQGRRASTGRRPKRHGRLSGQGCRRCLL